MINTAEYATKLEQVTNGTITVEEWQAYCFQLLAEIIEENKDVMIRLKNR
jgi:hypothetical protein